MSSRIDMALVRSVECIMPNPGWWRQDPRHRHAWHELVYVTRGCYRCRAGGRVHRLGPGQYVLYPQGMPHSSTSPDRLALEFLLLQWTGGPQPSLVVGDDPQRRLQGLLMWMYAIRTGPGYEDPRLPLFVPLIVAQSRLDAAVARVPDSSDAFAQAVAWMRRSLDTRIQLAELARLARMSRDHFIRVFRRRLGTTPKQYLQRLRVETALTLVRDDRLPLAAAAERVGLSSAKYLSRLLRTHTGTGLRAWSGTAAAAPARRSAPTRRPPRRGP